MLVQELICVEPKGLELNVYLSDVGSAADSLFKDAIDPSGAFGLKWDAIPNGALVRTP